MLIFTYILSCLLLIISILPLIKNDYWTFRVFEYPRMQKLVLHIVALLLLFYVAPQNSFSLILKIALLLSSAYLIYQILPFTPLWKKQVLQAKGIKPDQQLKLFISNVYEFNENHSGCLDVIAKANPDVVFLLETNERWNKAVASLDNDYPHSIKVPLENTYGMLFFSKLPLKDSEVKYLVEDDIPSVHTKIQLPNGKWVQLYGLHPTPPVPNENPRSTERDKELLLVADLAKESKIPVIVFGDLNDVAWSYTTTLFLKISELLDPRRGRAFINTFHAKYPLMRFPLDHVFCSSDFKLIKITRMDNFNSDHFPVFVQLQYEAIAKHQQEDNKLDADQGDYQEAAEKKAKI
ncbi:endonuclease/exonuclease/phosphatase family protein [Sphingobacterium hungaricum]|uniref:Endonuclease n=2 Tax=Sphingobacterium hungaricum TaxID=2082723 RepID=A0A928UWG7_9SPHI|nr:endonuclease [Sphingobacterium hungaricum]